MGFKFWELELRDQVQRVLRKKIDGLFLFFDESDGGSVRVATEADELFVVAGVGQVVRLIDGEISGVGKGQRLLNVAKRARVVHIINYK
jgi:hypothetical protein